MKTEIYLILLITFLRVFENTQKIETQIYFPIVNSKAPENKI